MTQAFNLSQLANNLNSSGQLDATDGLVNAVPVGNGGTGVSSLTGIAYGNGTSAFTAATSAQIRTALGTLPVGSGGTGVTALTGLAYGNNTSAFTAATASQIVSAIGTTAVTNATNASYATTAGNGGVSSVNGQTGAVLTTTYGAVGSLVMAGTTNQGGAGTTLSEGATVAGSTLVRYNPNLAPDQPVVSSYSGVLGGLASFNAPWYARTFNEYAGASENLGLTGTWRLMTAIIMGAGAGWNQSNGQYLIALFVRVS